MQDAQWRHGRVAIWRPSDLGAQVLRLPPGPIPPAGRANHLPRLGLPVDVQARLLLG